MRIVFVGASKLAVATARRLLERGHEVVVVEKEKSVIDDLADDLDCGFLHGDGSKPAVLREADPRHVDILFCLAGDDQANIIAALVGRSLGFNRVVVKVEDPELEHICVELGLEHTIVPTRTISRFLTDMAAGRDILELSSMVKGEARFFSFVARDEDQMEVSRLELPRNARAICFYREGVFHLVDEDVKLQKGDEVLVITHSENLESLRERWAPRQDGEDAEAEV